MVGQVEREGRLPELLEDRAMGLVLESDLDELLLDRRGAFDGARLEDVVYEGPRDACKSIPLLVRKRLSSIEMTAFLTIVGIWCASTRNWFCSLKTPIVWPWSSNRSELLASWNWGARTAFSSEESSAATDMNIPNTNETRPSRGPLPGSPGSAAASGVAACVRAVHSSRRLAWKLALRLTRPRSGHHRHVGGTPRESLALAIHARTH